LHPRVWFGFAIAGLGVACGAMMLHYPENLRAPMWVGLAAAGSFAAAGVAIAAEELRAPRVGRYALLGLLLAMLAPPAWIAFGPGPRACSDGIGVGGLSFGAWPAPDLGCRFAFGVGAILLALMLLVFLGKWARGTLQ